jgi:hypothetical protein
MGYAEPPASQPSDDAAWNEVGFTEDTLRDAWQQRVYQFKVGFPQVAHHRRNRKPQRQRERARADRAGSRDHPRFSKGHPRQLGPFEHLYEGKPGGNGTKELQNGVQKDGSAKFFRLVISGVNVHYHVTIEDQSPGSGKKKGGGGKKKGK